MAPVSLFLLISIIVALFFGVCMCELEVSAAHGTAYQEESLFRTVVSALTSYLSNGVQAGSLGSAFARPTRAVLGGVDALLVLLALVRTLGKQPESCANDDPVIDPHDDCLRLAEDAESEGWSTLCDTRTASSSEYCGQRSTGPEAKLRGLLVSYDCF